MVNPPLPDREIRREDMVAIFEEIGRACQKDGAYYEIAVYGGSALMLSFDYRQATFDIDYVPVTGASDKIVEMANQAASALGLSQHILRDDVSIFVSEAAQYKLFGEYPKGEGHFRIFTATAEYIFAMKMLSMRRTMESQDLRDIWELTEACGIDDLEGAVELLEKFYPGRSLPVRNRLILEDVFEHKRQNKPYSPALGW